MTALNVDNRTIFCHDNLEVLQGINSNCIDLIYLDPPFNKNKRFTAPVGSSAEGAFFNDIFREEHVKDEWLQTIKEDQPELYSYLTGIKGVGKSYNFAYLAYMAIRLLECHRILRGGGSIYLHCDPTMSHYLKTTMDCIFGEKNFRNEIVWKRNSSHNDSKVFGRVVDYILFYGHPIQSDAVRVPLNEDYVSKAYRNTDERGRYFADNLTAKGLSGGGYIYDFHGHNGPWRYPEHRMKELEADNRIHLPKKAGGVPCFKRYLHENKGQIPSSIWIDIPSARGKERTGFPTQKPLALLERIIKASSKEGDMVLDPFCGCATTCVAAERLGRKWIGIDREEEAYNQVMKRLIKEVATDDDLIKRTNEIILKRVPPKRTDLGEDHREQKWVYVISNPSYPGEYKVGIASDPRARLNQYQTGSPDRAYKIEFQHQTPAFRETEAHIHTQFDNKHEWVTGNLEEIVNAIKTFKP